MSIDKKTQKNVTVLLKPVAITNLDKKVWTYKNGLPKGNFPRSLTPIKIIRQRNFKLTDIEYGLIKYKISTM